MDFKLKLRKGPTIKIVREKNKLKNRGMSIKLNGIKIKKLSSKVREFDIQ